VKRTRQILHEPVELATRQVSTSLLETSTKTSHRLRNAEDEEALHDFRVSIRRLTTFLVAYRQHIGKRFVQKIRGRLAKLIKSTNAGRDQEVHLQWLRRRVESGRIPALQRKGLAMVLAELSDHPDEPTNVPVDRVLRRFASTRDRLYERFERPLRVVQLDENDQMLDFASATGEILSEQAMTLRRRLKAVETVDHIEAAHKARLAAKRLRYLIEPIRSVVVGGRDAINRLKTLQDLLGDMRDLQNLESKIVLMIDDSVQVMADELVRTARCESQVSAISANGHSTKSQALAAALQRVRTEERRLFESLQRRWLTANSDSFFNRIDRIVDQLAPGEVAVPVGEAPVVKEAVTQSADEPESAPEAEEPEDPNEPAVPAEGRPARRWVANKPLAASKGSGIQTRSGDGPVDHPIDAGDASPLGASTTG
jgi:CHAD domain-containing protein